MTFRIAHASDLHITGAEGEREMLEGLFTSMREYGVDHVVITGDISEDGDPDCFRLLDDVRQEFGYGARRATIVIGNHDLPGKIAFGRRFGSEWVKLRELAGGSIRLVTLDSAGINGGIGPRVHNPAGWLEPEQLDELERLVARGPTTGVTTVVALHHFVHEVAHEDLVQVGGSYVGLWGPLANADEFLDVLGRFGVDLVLTGHSHTARSRTLRRRGTSIRCLIGGATLDVEVGYRILDFARGRLISEGWVPLCESCWESKRVVCDACDDDAEVPCDVCDGDGYLFDDEDAEVECETCEATGYVGCSECDGAGELLCPDCA